ncbi:MAG: tRNA(His) guanylyltransferase Thg1 family protein [Myxococcota bacterium]
MSRDDVASRMRAFEAAHDDTVLPGVYTVVRLDGRGFTRLTKEQHDFERPFDGRFRAMMIETTAHLMQETGIEVRLAYTQSDEISLVLDPASDAFGRRVGKLTTVLAGAASACFSLQLGAVAVFDARVCPLPHRADVLDYVAWRQADAHRNALSGHAYWALRGEGLNAQQATERLRGASVSDKNELLFARGTNVDELPAWQKQGVVLLWESYEREGVDPRTGETTTTTRRRLATKLELPYGAPMRDWLQARLADPPDLACS